VTARLVSVNVVHALITDVRGELDETAIDKRGVSGRVRVRPAAAGAVGLDGDQVVDVRHHGGPDQAVYAYAMGTCAGGPTSSAASWPRASSART
jgi:MOSC domain-containing protein YiiM